ncbi:MAG TPA: amino acid adenylation domain-containing protein, partial [Candidatus Kapabacteria bacterium]|nr:amino acid adenylation domain-containing protein [Candidatus Kapabacteria bacterium]
SETNPNDQNTNDQNKNQHSGAVSVLNFENLNFEFVSCFGFRASNFFPSNLAYIIYTSGSTGKPKGVMVEHRNVVRLVKNTGYLRFSPRDRLLPTGSSAFDITTFEIWGPLCNGAFLSLTSKDVILNAEKLRQVLLDHGITILHLIPALFNQLAARDMELFAGLRYFLVGGDKVSPVYINALRRKYTHLMIFHMYGPTENTTFSTFFPVESNYEFNIPIGKPIANSTTYIVDKYDQLQPIGVPGELVVGGDGLARGYLNNPELTAERFVKYRFYGSYKTYINYKTGDLARWLDDGNIEFLGRIDQQVKIRGFRIELGEIEAQLIKYPGIKEAVVSAQEESGDKSLCAYIVPSPGLAIMGLREYLVKKLPDYMIPSYFVQMEKIPLTPNGKIDRKALPKPELKAGDIYLAPRDHVERKLVELWAGILGRDAAHASQLQTSIGIDDNFFQLGGHSLKATILVSKIHKVFQVNVPLAEIFKTSTIKGLANYIKATIKDKYVSIEPVEKKKYYSLSSSQKRLYILYEMDRQQAGYNIPSFSILKGEIDKNRLEQTFTLLIARHESLRTSFHIINDEPMQQIHDNVKFEIEELDGRGDSLWSPFIRPFDLSQAPLLRVGLQKIKKDKHILMVDMHHIISDGTSMNILVKDFMALYQGKYLSGLQLQYKDFSNWQNIEKQKESIKRQEDFWIKEFAGEIPVLELPVDYPRPAVQSFAGHQIPFEIDKETTGVLKTLALEMGATMYMILLSLYTVFLAKLTNQEDIVIGSPIAGRRHTDLAEIIGMFVNTLALRNYPAGEKKFPDFLEEIKEKTLKAFATQDYPYEDLVERVVIGRDTSRNPLFDTMFALQNMEIAGINIPGLKLSPYPYENKTAKFDLTLTAVEVEEKLLFNFEYCTKLFKAETINRFITYFKNVVKDIIDNKDRRIGDFEIITEEEKKHILFDFNNTEAEYPNDKTIHQLFAEQVVRTPDHVAVFSHGPTRTNTDNIVLVGADLRVCPNCLTYHELNDQSDRLAGLLIEKGVLADTIVAIMMERSIELIIGIMGILKSGGAYLPIDPDYPQERIDYMLKDSKAKLTINYEFLKEAPQAPLHHLSFDIPRIPRIPRIQHSNHLAYVIYTSGSTGKPKGVMAEHGSIFNTIYWRKQEYNLGVHDRTLQLFSFAFDGFLTSFFTPIVSGASVVQISSEKVKDIDYIKKMIVTMGITHFICVPSLYLMLLEISTAAQLGSLKVVTLAGEQFQLDLVTKSKQLNSLLEIVNEYGPTEGSVVTSICRDIQPVGVISIGKPIANNGVYIIDKNERLLPIGIPGQLVLFGKGPTRGYLNNPELT